jgi:hypothetical protein
MQVSSILVSDENCETWFVHFGSIKHRPMVVSKVSRDDLIRELNWEASISLASIFRLSDIGSSNIDHDS